MSQKLKIAAYVYPDALRNPTGVSMLTLNMVKMLAGNPQVQLTLLASESELDSGRQMPAELGIGDIPVVPLPWKRATRETLWLATNLPSIDRYVSADSWLYCSMENYVPARRCKRIVTVHHLEPMRSAPLWTKRGFRERTRAWRLRKAITTADLIVVQSSFTGNQVHEQYGIARERMAVVGSGVDDSLLMPASETGAGNNAARYAPYVISAGAFQLRKGTDYLFAMARELQRRGSPLKIVCPFGSRGLAPFVDDVKTLPNVVALDYISRDELLELIRGAICMVIPSRLEGFGLTAIESMALGTPVVASNNSALPETLGGAGVLVDPTDATALADAVEKLFKNGEYRNSLVARGNERVKNFTWMKCMERLVVNLH